MRRAHGQRRGELLGEARRPASLDPEMAAAGKQDEERKGIEPGGEGGGQRQDGDADILDPDEIGDDAQRQQSPA